MSDYQRRQEIVRLKHLAHLKGHEMGRVRTTCRYVDPDAYTVVCKCVKCGQEACLSYVGGKVDRWGFGLTHVCKQSWKTLEFELEGCPVTVEIDGKGGGNINVEGLFFPANEDEDSQPWVREQDAIEAVILAHACAGIDIMSEQYQVGLRAACDGIAQNQA